MNLYVHGGCKCNFIEAWGGIVYPRIGEDTNTPIELVLFVIGFGGATLRMSYVFLRLSEDTPMTHNKN